MWPNDTFALPHLSIIEWTSYCEACILHLQFEVSVVSFSQKGRIKKLTKALSICVLVDTGSWAVAIFWRSWCDVTSTSGVISSRLGSTLSGQMIRIRDRLIGSQSSQKCQSFLLGGSFYSASEIPWGRIGVNGSTLAYSNLLIFIGPKSNHYLSLSVTHCCKLQCNAMYTIHGDTY